jgi:phospholipase/carboxylesterase
MRVIRTQLGGLDCTVLPPPEGLKPEKVLILCHGYGAPGNDLVPLAPELVELKPELEKRVLFVFPEAPLSLAELGMAGARAWWHLPDEWMSRIQQGIPAGGAEMEAGTPEGMAEARQKLMGVVEAVIRSTGLGAGQLVLGGFSQGAMTATDVALRMDEAPAALVLYSGALVSKSDWAQRAQRRKGLRVIQTHGEGDAILAFKGAEALRDVLEQAGLQVDFFRFKGGHTISGAGLEGLASLL